MSLALVQALTSLAFANTEAIQEAPANLIPFLEATARAADEAARLVERDHIDQLTPQQLKMIEGLKS